MLTRRDQVQAYRFAQTRVTTALLDGEPDRAETPIRRQRSAAFGGVLLAVLLVTGFGIYGVIHPGGRTGWTAKGTLVIEKETGTRYVYTPADGLLHPVLNYASARLILNSASITVGEFSRSSLAGVPRGSTRGIAGLPDALPGASGVVAGPWLVCSGSGSVGLWSTISVGVAPDGQRPGISRAVLVAAPDGREFLVWNDTRMEVRATSALTAWGIEVTPLTVTAAWIDALTPGPDLVAPTPAGLGEVTSYRVGDATTLVGQVQRVPAAGGVGDLWFVALRDGLRSVPPSVARLMLADPAEGVAYPDGSPAPVSRTLADVAAAPRSGTDIVPSGFPDAVPSVGEVPTASTGGGSTPDVCAVDTAADGNGMTTQVYLGGQGRGAGLPTAIGRLTAAHPSDGPLPSADVLVPPGKVAVVRPLPHAGQPSDALFLVTDAGVKFPVPSAGVLGVLGLGTPTPALVPSGITDAVPTGPALDPTRADTDVPVPLTTSDPG